MIKLKGIIHRGLQSISWKQYGVDDWYSDNKRDDKTDKALYKVVRISDSVYACMYRNKQLRTFKGGRNARLSAMKFIDNFSTEKGEQ